MGFKSTTHCEANIPKPSRETTTTTRFFANSGGRTYGEFRPCEHNQKLESKFERHQLCQPCKRLPDLTETNNDYIIGQPESAIARSEEDSHLERGKPKTVHHYPDDPRNRLVGHSRTDPSQSFILPRAENWGCSTVASGKHIDATISDTGSLVGSNDRGRKDSRFHRSVHASHSDGINSRKANHSSKEATQGGPNVFTSNGNSGVAGKEHPLYTSARGLGHGPESATARWPSGDVIPRLVQRTSENVLEAQNQRDAGHLPGARQFGWWNRVPSDANDRIGSQHDQSTTDCASTRNIQPVKNTSIDGQNDTTRTLTRMLGNLWPQQIKQSRKPEGNEWNLPLHLKNTSHINWQKASQMILPPFREAWNWGLNALTSYEFISHHCTDTAPIENIPHAQITQQDLETLLQKKVIRNFSGTPRGTVRVFTVVEAGKNRRRLITEPSLNKTFLYPGDIRLPSVEGVIDIVRKHEGAVLFDFAHYYHQFRLAEDVQCFYVFQFNGELFCLTVIPTGARQSASIAHSLTASLAEKAAENTTAEAQAYLDNVRFAGSEPATRISASNFLALCADISATTNETEGKFSRQYEFLGISFNHQNCSVSLSQKTKTKLLTEAELWNSELNFSVRRALQSFGIILWSMRVLRIPLANIYYLLKFLRRRSQRELDSVSDPWETLRNDVPQFIQSILSNNHRRIEEAQKSDLTIFTDASSTGFGIIIFSNQHIRIIAGQWEVEEHIAILEARAFYYGTTCLEFQQEQTELAAFLDNSALVGALEAEHSRNFTLNIIIRRALCELRDRKLSLRHWWIPTAFMLADAASRLGSPLVRWSLVCPGILAYTIQEYRNCNWELLKKKRAIETSPSHDVETQSLTQKTSV